MDIISHARVLCRPAYLGREAGTVSEEKAAEYIIEQFRRVGVQPGGSAGGFYQPFKIAPGYQITSELYVTKGKQDRDDFHRGRDYRPVYIPQNQVQMQAECLLAGYGLTIPDLHFDEYQNSIARGKAVIVFSGAPWIYSPQGWEVQNRELSYYQTLAYKIQNAAAHGAVCLIIVDNPVGWRKQLAVPERLHILESQSSLRSPIPVLHATREFLTEITAMSLQELQLLAQDTSRERTSQSLLLRGRQLHLKAQVSGSALLGRNIIGILPGRDPTLRRQAVVLGAHYDHLGMGQEGIYFGANDNAAGVGALLAIAQAFTRLAEVPKRTIIFVAFDAEEIGKRGSRHYVSHPCLPIDQTVLMINFDMIGRNDPNQIYAVGTHSSPELHAIHQQANSWVRLRLIHPESYRLGRSDHTAFYYAQVPILYLFGGLDPDYNTPFDTWDKLIPSKVEKVARLAFLTALTVANRTDRISFASRSEYD